MAVKTVKTVRVILHVSLEYDMPDVADKVADRVSKMQGVTGVDIVTESGDTVEFDDVDYKPAEVGKQEDPAFKKPEPEPKPPSPVRQLTPWESVKSWFGR